MSTKQKRGQGDRRIRKAVRRILSAVERAAALGEEARQAHADFLRLTSQRKGATDAK